MWNKRELLQLTSGSLADYFFALLRSIQDGLLVIDKEGVVLFINPEYTRITGVTEAEIVGKPLLSVRPNAQLVEVMKQNKVVVGIRRKERNVEYVVDMAPIVLGGRVEGAVSICKGAVEVHELVKKLEKNNKEIKRLQQGMNSLSKAKYSFEHIIGAEGDLKAVIAKAKKVARSSISVVIYGESGTGKELLAQAIHNESDRSDKPFVAVNCAAIPEALLESELFGYEEGAFTNAKRGGKLGLFELAHRGTLFLDEISELPYDIQAKLLRVLQESAIRRVGGVSELEVDVRVIAAANKDLAQMVEKGRFREDLFYRLNAFMLQLLPLRVRHRDIEVLVDSMLKHETRANSQDAEAYVVEPEVMDIFARYHWPGNVRQLKNVIDYAVCMAEGNTITPRDLPDYIRQEHAERSSGNQGGGSLKEAVEQAERAGIAQALKRTDNTLEGRRQAAQMLGVSLATLYNKIKKYDLEEIS